jgi:transcriptional regulator with XRE-family HTH domain
MISKVLKAFRQKHDISLRAFQKQIGISYPTLCRIESGKTMDQASMLKLINWLFNTNCESQEVKEK